MRASADCILCLLQKKLETAPAGGEERLAFLREAFETVLSSDPAWTTPQLSKRIDALFSQRFGDCEADDYRKIKQCYNEKMLSLEAELRQRINAAQDPLALAMILARVGNYIDFGAVAEVDDALLQRLIRNAESEMLDPIEYVRFREESQSARSILYITDNCGEIVLDKLLLQTLRQRNPNARYAVLVRGKPTLNDATLEDAHRIGLDEEFTVIGNGTDYPGTVVDEISEEARDAFRTADLIVSKGQANFETLNGCGANIYYLFLCKCNLFSRRFAVPCLTGMLVNERRCPPLYA